MELTRVLASIDDALTAQAGPDIGAAVLTQADRRLIAVLQEGLPLISRPYAAIGARVGLSEEQVLSRLASMLARGIIKRMGVIVRHHELGYRANAMVVWDIPDERVAQIGYEGFMRGKRVVVAGAGNRLVALILRAMPHGFLLRVTDQTMRAVARQS